MRTTIDVPDDLYRRVKVRAARLGRPVREVTIELYRRWLGQKSAPGESPSGDEWLDEWRALGASLTLPDRELPSAREVIAADRARTESR